MVRGLDARLGCLQVGQACEPQHGAQVNTTLDSQVIWNSTQTAGVRLRCIYALLGHGLV